MGKIVTPFEDISPFGKDTKCEDLYNYVWYLAHKRNKYECHMSDADSFIDPFCEWLAAMTLVNWALSADLDIEPDLKAEMDKILARKDYNQEVLPDYPDDGINHCNDDYVFEPGDTLREWLVDSTLSVTDRAIRRCADKANGPDNEILYMYQERGAGTKPSLKKSAMMHMTYSIRCVMLPLLSTMNDMGIGCELCDMSDTSTNYPKISSVRINTDGELHIDGHEYEVNDNDVAIIVSYLSYDEYDSDTAELIMKSAVVGLLDNVSNAIVLSFANTEYATQATKEVLETLKKHGLKKVLMTADSGGDGSIMHFNNEADYQNAFTRIDLGSRNYTHIVSSNLVPSSSIIKYVANAFDKNQEVIDAVMLYMTIMHEREYVQGLSEDYCGHMSITECIINAYNALETIFCEKSSTYSDKIKNTVEKGLETPYGLNGVLSLKCLIYDLNVTSYIRSAKTPTKLRIARELIERSGLDLLDAAIENEELVDSGITETTTDKVFEKRSENIATLAREYGLESIWSAVKNNVPLDDLLPARCTDNKWFVEMDRRISKSGSIILS